MKRVREFLYDRGGSYYFRRAVPPEAREAFGGRREMLVSLKTRNLSDARLRLGQHLREFERTLSKATGRPDPTASTEPRHVQPTLAEIDAAVRAWVKERLHNYTPPNGDVRTRLQGLEQEAVSLGTRYEFGEAMPDLQTEWIAEAIRDEAGWPVSEGTPLFDHLIRMVARGTLSVRDITEEVYEKSYTRRGHPMFGYASIGSDLTINKLLRI